MDILATLRYLLLLRIRRRLRSPVSLGCMPLEECLLDCVIPLLHFRGAWFLFSQIQLSSAWKFSWMTSLHLGLPLMIVSLTWETFCKCVGRKTWLWIGRNVTLSLKKGSLRSHYF